MHPPKTLRREEATKKSGPAKVTETRFVMVRHTVQILADYDGLKGVFAEVIEGDTGDGKIVVKLGADSAFNRTGKDRQILLCRGEWQLVVGGDCIRHGCRGEFEVEGRLIRRSADLFRWETTDLAPKTTERIQAVEKRLAKLRERIREQQRRESEHKAAAWLQLTGKPFCNSMVLWTGKEGA